MGKQENTVTQEAIRVKGTKESTGTESFRLCGRDMGLDGEIAGARR